MMGSDQPSNPNSPDLCNALAVSPPPFQKMASEALNRIIAAVTVGGNSLKLLKLTEATVTTCENCV